MPELKWPSCKRSLISSFKKIGSLQSGTGEAKIGKFHLLIPLNCK